MEQGEAAACRTAGALARRIAVAARRSHWLNYGQVRCHLKMLPI
jgi:hypothetical protein